MKTNPKTENLASWLTSPLMDCYHGRAYTLRNEVLAHFLTGKGELQEIAKRHGVCKSAITRHVRRAREIFGPELTSRELVTGKTKSL